MQTSPASDRQTPRISGMPVRLTSTSGIASRCFIVGRSVCPPPSACAPSVDMAATASAIVPGLANSKSYMGSRASFTAGRTLLLHLSSNAPAQALPGRAAAYSAATPATSCPLAASTALTMLW